MLLVILVVVVVLEHYDAAACVLLRATRLFLFSSRSDRISLVNAYSFFYSVLALNFYPFYSSVRTNLLWFFVLVYIFRSRKQH